MGDHTDCYLTLKTPATPELVVLIDERMYFTGNHLDREFYFEDVNYAKLDPLLLKYLQDNALPFTWSWYAGGGYDPGIYIFDGQEGAEFLQDWNGEIVIPLSQVEVPGAIANAVKWQKIRKEIQA